LYTFIGNTRSLLDVYQPTELVKFMTSEIPKMAIWPLVPQMLPIEEHNCSDKRKKKNTDDDVRNLIAQMRKAIPDSAEDRISCIPAPMTRWRMIYRL